MLLRFDASLYHDTSQREAAETARAGEFFTDFGKLFRFGLLRLVSSVAPGIEHRWLGRKPRLRGDVGSLGSL